MADGLRNHEIAAALEANERALRSLADAIHDRAGAFRALQLEVANLRAATETQTAVFQTLVGLRREELALERDRLEHENTGEVMRAEADAKARAEAFAAIRDGARGVGLFLQTRSGQGVLVLCGMVIARAIGTEKFADLASNMLALAKGFFP